jgi:hypothetical protein
MRPIAFVLVAVVATALSLGCKSRECETVAAQAQEHMSQGRLDQARVLVRMASDGCSSSPMYSAARDALAAAEKRDAEEQAAAALKEETEAIKDRSARVAAFLDWVAVHMAAPDKVGNDTECYKPSDPEAGYCETSVTVGNALRTVTWRKGQLGKFSFASEVLPKRGPELRCRSIGATEVRHWRWSTALLSHCRLGPSLHVWIKNAELGLYLRVFSDAYLDGAPYDFEETLRTQGETL